MGGLWDLPALEAEGRVCVPASLPLAATVVKEKRLISPAVKTSMLCCFPPPVPDLLQACGAHVPGPVVRRETWYPEVKLEVWMTGPLFPQGLWLNTFVFCLTVSASVFTVGKLELGVMSLS